MGRGKKRKNPDSSGDDFEDDSDDDDEEEKKKRTAMIPTTILTLAPKRKLPKAKRGRKEKARKGKRRIPVLLQGRLQTMSLVRRRSGNGSRKTPEAEVQQPKTMRMVTKKNRQPKVVEKISVKSLKTKNLANQLRLPPSWS